MKTFINLTSLIFSITGIGGSFGVALAILAKHGEHADYSQPTGLLCFGFAMLVVSLATSD